MTVPYATPTQLATFLGATPAPADAARMLIRASELIDAKILASFTLGDDGLPTDETTAGVLADATCAVVEAWAEVGEENDIDGLAGTDIAVQGYSGPRAPELPPRARRLLATAGMFTSPVPLAGTFPGGRW